MSLIVLAMLFSSCTPTPQGKTDLPRYSDMGAAEDAGRVK